MYILNRPYANWINYQRTVIVIKVPSTYPIITIVPKIFRRRRRCIIPRFHVHRVIIISEKTICATNWKAYDEIKLRRIRIKWIKLLKFFIVFVYDVTNLLIKWSYFCAWCPNVISHEISSLPETIIYWDKSSFNFIYKKSNSIFVP